MHRSSQTADNECRSRLTRPTRGICDRNVSARAIGLAHPRDRRHAWCTINGADARTHLHHLWGMPRSEAVSRPEWRSQFGTRLRQMREERGLTQEALAEEAGVDRKLIYRTELAQTSPRMDAVVSIAGALGVPVQQLMPDQGS
jgi:DNA-binding XRE family transcriptional regulator